MVFKLSEITVAEIVSIKGGKRLPAGKSLQSNPSNHPYIRVRDVGQRRLSMEGVEYVPDDVFPSISRYIVHENDIVLSIVGTIGALSIVNASYNGASLTENCVKLTGLDYYDALYLYYYLNSGLGQQEISKGTVGAVQPKLPIYNIEKIKVLWPSEKEDRQKIASILGGIDDKIELNRRINQTLEAMAQALFKSWFVDFDPVKAKNAAKAEGRDPLRAAVSAISGKSDAELDMLSPEQYKQLAATAALFPDHLEESEFGSTPSGWAIRAMPDCIDVNPSRQLRKGSIALYLDMANVPTNSARVQNVVAREFSSGSKFQNGDTLLARITPCLENGKTAFVDFLSKDDVGWGSTEFIVLRPKSELPPSFAYFLCRDPEFRAFAIAQMAGTSGRQRVPNDCFASYKLVEPDAVIAAEFGQVAASALGQIKALDLEAKALASLRDTLLPKLLTGELSVETLAKQAGIA
ncbi:restriction endonuclease subunit S [Pseudomonas putida]|nr:restriction endonuclease subunit S [Pseudomonas putida]